LEDESRAFRREGKGDLILNVGPNLLLQTDAGYARPSTALKRMGFLVVLVLSFAGWQKEDNLVF